MLWGKRADDKSRWSEIARDCLAVGAIVKIIWDWNIPITISGPVLFGMMFASLFGITRDIIAISAFLLFIVTFTISYPEKGAMLIGVFVVFAIIAKIFRKRYI
ncbi:MAG: hypothetical protein ABIL39_11995 [candidate division WOR-3 bacterium]